MSRSVHRRDGGWRLRWAILVAGDLLAAALAYLLAFLVRVVVPFPLTIGYLPPLRFAEVHHHWPELLLTQLGVLYFLGLYEAHALTRPRDHAGPLVATGGLVALLLIATYFFRQDLVFPRSIFVVFAALDATLLVGWRIGSRPLLGSYPRRRVLVVGSNAAAAEVIDTIRVQHWLGMDIVGAVASDGVPAGAVHDVPLLGSRDDLAALCQRNDVDEVIIASDAAWQDHLLDALSRAEGTRARVCVVPSAYEILIGRTEHLRLHDIPLIEVIRDPLVGSASAVKRVFDVALAAVLFVVALPVMLLVALAVRLTSRGPVLFRQERLGKDRRPFTMLKFRTMHVDAEQATGPVLASTNDPRVTWLGRWLRGARLDELPQLWNVLRGDMSFVGPRPERPEFVVGFERHIHGYIERFKVRPGLTGYAQVNGEYHTSAATKLKYDLAYIYNRSLWLDFKILSETVKVIMTRKGV
jgi:exopolysaccharide biosynthesis polyprenyl glycosylphosphotransferase